MLRWCSLAIALLVWSCVDSTKAKSAPDIQLNENPEKSYNLDVRFVETPGPLEDIAIMAHYKVGDYCTPPEPLSGAVLPPEHDMLLPLRKIDDGRYEAVFHQDALRDDDYFGSGVCRWALQNISVKFKSPSTRFVASLPDPESEIQPNPTKIQHYLNADYFKKPAVGEVVFGENAGFYLPKTGAQFKVVLATKKSLVDK